jgi:hypothetical protein
MFKYHIIRNNTLKQDIVRYHIAFSASLGRTCKKIRVNVRKYVSVQEIWRPFVPVLREDSLHVALCV